MSFAAALGSRTTVNRDISTAKNFMLHFKSAMRSFIYTRKNGVPKIEP